MDNTDIKIDPPGGGLQAGPYQPFYPGLRNHDGAVSAVQCGVCFFYGKVRYLHAHGPGHAEYLHRVRPVGARDDQLI